MADTATLEHSTLQNLRDAGCDDVFIEQFGHAADADRKEMICLLQKHRAKLLDDSHRCNKKIDCLDYLIHKIEKQQQEGACSK